MTGQGYICEAGKFIEKKDEEEKVKIKAKTVTKTKSKKKKKSKAEPTLQEKQRAILKKYGRFDFELGLYIINPTIVTILENQENKVSIEETAKQVNMTVRTMHNYMKINGYIWDKKKYIKESELEKQEEMENVQDELLEVEEVQPLIRPKKIADVDGPIFFNKQDIKDIRAMYKWFLANKDKKVFQI